MRKCLCWENVEKYVKNQRNHLQNNLQNTIYYKKSVYFYVEKGWKTGKTK